MVAKTPIRFSHDPEVGGEVNVTMGCLASRCQSREWRPVPAGGRSCDNLDRMSWHLSADVEAFTTAAGDLLRRDPAANTVMLTAIAEYRAGQRWSPAEPVFGWRGLGVQAAMCRFPPYELAVSEMSIRDASELAEVVAPQQVPAVRGPVQTVEAFTTRWVQRSGATPEPGRRQRLYRLTRLLEPPERAGGVGQLARAADVGIVVRWLNQFAAEAGSVPVDRTAWAINAVRSGLIWTWHDHDEVVAVACRHLPVESTSRVGPVYTPPEHRQRGYGTAVTAAITADALTRGATQTVLFADLADATANGIYTTVGYRPVHDVHTVHFHDPGSAVGTALRTPA
jgi:predicted GNAT family acetyltransferase